MKKLYKSSISLFRWWTRKERPHVVTFLPPVIMLVFYYLPIRIPSRTATAFYLYRDEFIALADSSISEVRNTGRGFRLPESPLYESAAVDRDFISKALIMEFIVDDYYLPLVYISTDNPDDTRGACSEDGGPLERLEPKWYVCRRDWN